MNARTKTAYSLRPMGYSEGTSIIEARYEPTAILGVPMNYFAVLLSFLLLIASGLFWVWVRVEHIKTAYHINDLQNQLIQLDENERLLEVERASLRRPDRLRRMAKKQFKMHAPRLEQVVKLESLNL